MPHQIVNRTVNLEDIQPVDDSEALEQQNIMSCAAAVELLDQCDRQDRTIAILDGTGSLTLLAQATAHDELITLEPGMLVFVPAHTRYHLKTQTPLTALLIRSQAIRDAQPAAWVVKL